MTEYKAICNYTIGEIVKDKTYLIVDYQFNEMPPHNVIVRPDGLKRFYDKRYFDKIKEPK